MFLKDYLTFATFGLGALVAVSVALSCIFTGWYGKPKRNLPKVKPDDYALPYESVTFLSKGQTLKGWFIPPAGKHPPWPAIILAHGWSYNASSLLPLARKLHEGGYASLSFDFRGHGTSGSDGPMTILKFAEDTVSAMGYLEGRTDVDVSRVSVVGHSMGGAGGILAASMDNRIGALVSTSAFADPVALTRRYMKRFHIPIWPFLWFVSRCIEGWLGSPMDEVAPQNRIGRVTAPVLLIHGESDRFIPPGDMKDIYQRANGETTKSWLVPGRRHLDILHDADFAPRVISFLNEYMI